MKTNDQIVHAALLAATKARSNLIEILGSEERAILSGTCSSWLFGEDCILPMLNMLDERKGSTATEVMNVLYIAERAFPAESVTYGLPRVDEFIAERMGWYDQ
jgi:hypothetical protein